MPSKEIELYEALLNQKKQKGLEDLLFFNKYIMENNPKRRTLFVPHVHGEWAHWYKNSTKRIKMILVPRGCFKSTFFTIGRTIQAIAANRDERILVANATLNNAQTFLGEMKDHFVKNDTLKTLYGDFYDPKLRWNESEIVVTNRSNGVREANVTAAGVGGNLVSQHYSKIICDDLVNLENSATRYQSDKVIDWWKRAFSLLDYDGEMIIIGTRWSYYELYSWIVEKYPDMVDTYIRGAYNPDGSLYFPELLDEQKLQELKGLQGSYVFSAFYLNDPVDEDSALIKRSQVRYYGPGEASSLPANLNIFAVCDPAVSQSEQSDYSCILVIGVSPENDWYVLEMRREKWTVGELIEQLFAVNELWKPVTISIEMIGQAQGLMTPIRDEEDRRNKYLPLFEINARPDIRKEMRIRSVLQPRFERGKIFIQREMFELEDEILKFPRGKHDDMIDAMTDMDEICFSPEPEKTPEIRSNNHFENLLRKKEEEQNPGDYFMGEDF
jgi:predicted phage terminase large subunit-like protein